MVLASITLKSSLSSYFFLVFLLSPHKQGLYNCVIMNFNIKQMSVQLSDFLSSILKLSRQPLVGDFNVDINGYSNKFAKNAIIITNSYSTCACPNA